MRLNQFLATVATLAAISGPALAQSTECNARLYVGAVRMQEVSLPGSRERWNAYSIELRNLAAQPLEIFISSRGREGPNAAVEASLTVGETENVGLFRRPVSSTPLNLSSIRSGLNFNCR